MIRAMPERKRFLLLMSSLRLLRHNIIATYESIVLGTAAREGRVFTSEKIDLNIFIDKSNQVHNFGII